MSTDEPRSNRNSTNVLIPVNELKLIRIENTQNLGVIEVSSAYHDETAARTDLEMLSDARAMRCDRDGNLRPIRH